MTSKALATQLQDILPPLIPSNPAAYVKNKYISEIGRLIYDVLETVLQKHGFGEHFLKWIQISIKNQESRVANGSLTTKFFRLDRGTRQGDPISAFIFIRALEVSFVLIKTNNEIKGLDIHGHNFLYTAYADGSSFFFKNKKSVIEALKILDEFSLWVLKILSLG